MANETIQIVRNEELEDFCSPLLEFELNFSAAEFEASMRDEIWR
jgi:hypothetical protein